MFEDDFIFTSPCVSPFPHWNFLSKEVYCCPRLIISTAISEYSRTACQMGTETTCFHKLKMLRNVLI